MINFLLSFDLLEEALEQKITPNHTPVTVQGRIFPEWLFRALAEGFLLFARWAHQLLTYLGVLFSSLKSCSYFKRRLAKNGPCITWIRHTESCLEHLESYTCLLACSLAWRRISFFVGWQQVKIFFICVTLGSEHASLVRLIDYSVV